jgi:hypothetical protein
VACRAPPTAPPAACEGATRGVQGPLLIFSIVLLGRENQDGELGSGEAILGKG